MIKSHHFVAILPVSQTIFDWQTADFIQVLKSAANMAGLTVAGEVAFTFQPQGISAVIVLAESHVALHFWTEEAKVTIDIHVCDYQKDNLEKAKIMMQILTKEISSTDLLDQWHYLSITG